MSDNLRTDNAVPPQAGKVMIVTGATSGIGYETALALAKADASVVLASRNEAKGNMTLENIRRLRSALCALIPVARHPYTASVMRGGKPVEKSTV